jgi:hypothetical protein
MTPEAGHNDARTLASSAFNHPNRANHRNKDTNQSYDYQIKGCRAKPYNLPNGLEYKP